MNDFIFGMDRTNGSGRPNDVMEVGADLIGLKRCYPCTPAVQIAGGYPLFTHAHV